MSAEDMRVRLSAYTSALSALTNSTHPTPFQILHTHTHSALPSRTSHSPTPKLLYILDSSFNPPTRAHLRIVLSALTSTTTTTTTAHGSSTLPPPSRLLLLLALKNADKAPQPASFPQRLTMMSIFAREILAHASPTQCSAVDVAITTLPYFANKAHAIAASGAYPPTPPPPPSTRTVEATTSDDTSAELEQVHLIGFDTLTRILDPKYYPPDYRLEGLVPFLERHRLRVTLRADDQWGGRSEQEAYLNGVQEGSLEGVGGRREWVDERRIVLVEGRKAGEEPVSSSKVREAAKRRDQDALGRLVTDGVRNWIKEQHLYIDTAD